MPVQSTQPPVSTAVPAEYPSKDRFAALRSWGFIAAMVLVLLSALYLRLDDLPTWQAQPHRAFYKDQPLLINFDGYYYLSLARDLLDGSYGGADELRGVPQSPMLPVPPPLISTMAAGLASVTPISLNWIAVLLPPMLGILLAWPLYLIGRLYGGRLTAMVAVSLGLFSKYYVYRSHLGWFDTDCLNVTFVFLICYFFIRFGMLTGRRRFIHLASALACFVLFLLWWDQASALVVLICLSPLIIVLILYYRPTGRERWIALALVCLGLLALGLWKGPGVFIAPVKSAIQQWGYVAKQQAGNFPNVGVSVFEQKQLGLNDLVRNTTGHWATFLAGLVGLAILLWTRKQQAAALMVPFALGALSFFFARRFMIFLNPFLAIGLGYIMHQLWGLRSRLAPLAYAVPVLAAIVVLVPFRESLGKVYWPKEFPPLVEGMDYLARTTAKNSVVWAWWDHGYPMVYWARRATINDGSLHGGLRTVLNALPLATADPRLAANFIHFYVARGMDGVETVFNAAGRAEKGMALIRNILAQPPEQVDAAIAAAGLPDTEDWHDFFFPANSRPVYLYLDLRLARTAYWWSWFGTWDVARRDGSHAAYHLFPGCIHYKDRIKGPDIDVDLTQGLARVNKKTYALKEACLMDDALTRKAYDNHPKGLVLVYHAQSKTAHLLQPPFDSSLFSRLYLLKQTDTAYFALRSERFPYYQVWQVKASE